MFGVADPAASDPVAAFLLANPQPDASQIATFLKSFPDADTRNAMAQALIDAGINASTVSSALVWVNAVSKFPTSKVFGVLTLASATASAFHGYRRNQSIGWAIVWFAMGLCFPIFTPTIAIAQGFGKKAS
jgi:hypothetical protein